MIGQCVRIVVRGNDRPALVLSSDPSHVDLLPISSDLNAERAIPMTANDYASGSFPIPVAVLADRVVRVAVRDVTPLSVSMRDAFLAKVHKSLALRETRAFSKLSHAANREGGDPSRSAFCAGQSTIPYAGRVFTEDEVEAAVGATMDFWLTLGPEGVEFEKELAQLLGVRSSLLVNSGSSANLIALSTLTTHKLPSARRIQPGDEVITVAGGFPTTVAPILQCGAVPVFIDNEVATGNARVELLEAAFSPGKTKAVMMAHTLGNPFDLGAVIAFCRKHDLWLVEDNCDALGATYSMPSSAAEALGLFDPAKPHGAPRIESDGIFTLLTGAAGDLSTQSFYPPHHLTMGEGGAVNVVRRPPLRTYAESFRDWGRDCWCPSGQDNTCGKRFGWQLGELPEGYDHKYIYSHLGYNLKPLDPQAAIGRKQLKRLPAFIAARRANWETLRRGLDSLGEFFEFSLPAHATGWVSGSGAESEFTWDATGRRSHPSWFGFMLRVRESAPFSHSQLGRHLDERKIGNRMLFGGNLVRQPAFIQLRRDNPSAFRVVGPEGAIPSERLAEWLDSSKSGGSSPLPGADSLMRTALFLGTFPGLSQEMLEYEIETIHEFVKGF